MRKLFVLLCMLSGLGLVAQQDTSSGAKKKPKVTLGGDGFYLRDSTWHIGGYLGFNISQTALYQWGQGGANNFSFLVSASAYAKYKRGKVFWDTNLDMKYGMAANGMIRNSGLARRNLQKNIDVLQFSSNVGYDIADHLYFSGKLGFLSQFSPTYDYSQTDTAGGRFRRYVVSRFAAPAILTIGPGFTWKPQNYFTLFFSPIEAKMTFVSGTQKDTAHIQPGELSDAYYTGVDPTRFGLKSGTSFSGALGAELDILFQKDIVRNVNWKSHLNVFVSYYNSNYNTIVPYYYAAQDSMGTTTLLEKTSHIPVVTWDNDIVFKVNSFLSATLCTRFIYQYNVQTPVDKVHNSTGSKGPDGMTDMDKSGASILTYNKLQIFEQFGLGLTFKF